MTKQASLKVTVAIASALLVGACGGGGERPNIAPAPPAPPPPPPPPPPANSGAATGVIGAASSSQTFVSEGENLHFDGNLAVRYDASQNQYYVTVPGEAEALLEDPLWNVEPSPNESGRQYHAGEMQVTTRASSTTTLAGLNYQYSNIATVWSPESPYRGSTAFGMATPASAVPTTGAAAYSGFLLGHTSELVDYGDWGTYAAAIDGSINLSFNFGAGTLSGTLNPILYHYEQHDLGTLTITQPVWGVGSNAFTAGLSGSALTGDPAGIRGTFTGPAAQELIGGFFFGYVSPVTGQDASAAGAFLAQR